MTGHSGTGENWVCSRCTYKNPSNVTQCQMCGFSRDQAKLMDEFPPLGGEAKGKKKSAVGKKK